MLQIRLTVVMMGALYLASTLAVAADDAETTPKPAEPYLTLRLIDEEGKPVAGAKAGLWAIVNGFDDKAPGDWNFRFGDESDTDGVIRFREGEDMFRYRHIVYARHADKHLVAVQKFADKDQNGTVDLVLHPECHVRWRLTSTELEQSKHTLGRLSVKVAKEQSLFIFAFVHADTFHAVLPPGEFMLDCYGANVKPFVKEIEIPSGARELDLGDSDLAAQQVILLEGKPAPELEEISEWKNGPPLKLADLHGKVVLLEFWGWWCGPCVHRGIPEMFKLREEFSGADLVVIGLHTPGGEDDDIDSVEKLDTKLADVREKVWKGKDIDFPVAISRPKKGKYSDTSEPVTSSKACFDYGIFAFPSTVLIDRRGNVVGKFNAASEDDRVKLKKLLGSIVD